jgi:hypothetical protein
LHVEAFFGVLRPLLVLALFMVPLTWFAYPDS